MKTKGQQYYASKLKDPRWQRKRLEIMGRDDFKCVKCNSGTETLHVHHLKYKKGKEPWDYPDHNFETLCEGCHAGEHVKPNDRTSQFSITEEPEIDSLAFCEMDRTVAFLCHAILDGIVTPSHFKSLPREDMEKLSVSSKWLKGMDILQKLISGNTLVEAEELAVRHYGQNCGTSFFGDEEFVKEILRGIERMTLQERDSALKLALREPGITPDRMGEILEEAKEISEKLRWTGRSVYDDDPGPETIKKSKPWLTYKSKHL